MVGLFVISGGGDCWCLSVVCGGGCQQGCWSSVVVVVAAVELYSTL
jgi:hypothetical protein